MTYTADAELACRSLIAAIMEQGIADKDRSWIEDDDVRILGFVWCCSMLDIDADFARSRILGRPVRRSGRYSTGARKAGLHLAPSREAGEVSPLGAAP